MYKDKHFPPMPLEVFLSARNFIVFSKTFILPIQTLLTFDSPTYDPTIYESHDTRTTKTIASIANMNNKTRQLLCLNKPSPIVLIFEVSFHRRSVNNCVPHLEKLSLGVRAYGNGCLHVGNISGFVAKFFQCSNQIHFIHISNVTSTFACDVITSNISVTFEM